MADLEYFQQILLKQGVLKTQHFFWKILQFAMKRKGCLTF